MRATRSVRIGSIIGLCLTLLGLTGCTMVRLGYGSADELAYHWLDRWLDFNADQESKARAALVDVHQWHRRTQLPDYAQWFTRVSDEVMTDTSARDACRYSDELTERMVKSVERMLPATVSIALTLSDAQMQRMRKRFDEGQAKMRKDHLSGDAKARAAAQLERSVSRAEWLYGSLDDAQRAVLTAAVGNSPFDARQMIQERDTRQKELEDMLNSARQLAATGQTEAASTKLQAQLGQWLLQGRRSPRPAYAAYQQRVRAYNCELSARVHNAAAPATRMAARDRLRGWVGDVRSLYASAQ